MSPSVAKRCRKLAILGGIFAVINHLTLGLAFYCTSKNTAIRARDFHDLLRRSALFSAVEDHGSEVSAKAAAKPLQQQIYLFSLQWTPDERISKPCRDVWKWKDSVLGDGRDFFVPKPKTIRALQDLLQEHCDMTQVSVLSNCARLEIICVCKSKPISAICRCLMGQVRSKEASGTAPWSILTQSMDMPSLILQSTPLSTEEISTAKELEQHWNIKEGYRDVIHHLCLVSAGMAARPRRPDREVIFRPFSSRDAHILLQLKRTREIAQGKDVGRLLEYALRAGKAARNSDIVEELGLLRKYGTGDSKYCTNAPDDTIRQVVDAVMASAIDPLIDECIQSSIITDDLTEAIMMLRDVQSLARTPEERSWIRKRLHQPTMRLRDGSLAIGAIPSEVKRIQDGVIAFRAGLSPNRPLESVSSKEESQLNDY